MNKVNPIASFLNDIVRLIIYENALCALCYACLEGTNDINVEKKIKQTHSNI